MSDEKKIVKYKLIDEEGFINEDIFYNPDILRDYIKDGYVAGDLNSYDGCLDVGYVNGNITKEELAEYFELVVEEEKESQHLWDGKETLEVEMVVSLSLIHI